jgi:hypothetical protein
MIQESKIGDRLRSDAVDPGLLSVNNDPSFFGRQAGAAAVLLLLVAGHLVAPVAAYYSCSSYDACQYPGCGDVSDGNGGVYYAYCVRATSQLRIPPIRLYTRSS